MERSFFVLDVFSVIKSLKSDKPAGVDEIRAEMLKALEEEEVLWLCRVIEVAWQSTKGFRTKGLAD